MEKDGRPQGATRPIHPTPVPTMYEQNWHRYIVGTGAVRMGWVAPCGRPSSPVIRKLPVLPGKNPILNEPAHHLPCPRVLALAPSCSYNDCRGRFTVPGADLSANVPMY